MAFIYLHKGKELTRNPLLDKFLEKYKHGLKEYKSIEIGAGNLLNSIPISHYFTKYDAIEPDQVLYNIGKRNIERYESSIDLRNEEFSDCKEEYDLVIFINSIHFIDTALLRAKYILVIHPKYDGDNFGDTRLNRNSDNFNLVLWHKNKSQLEKYERFIRDNYKIVYEDSNKKQTLLVCKR